MKGMFSYEGIDCLMVDTDGIDLTGIDFALRTKHKVFLVSKLFFFCLCFTDFIVNMKFR